MWYHRLVSVVEMLGLLCDSFDPRDRFKKVPFTALTHRDHRLIYLQRFAEDLINLIQSDEVRLVDP